MKTTRRGLALFTLALLLGLPLSRALAVFSEPPDFPNDVASAATYVLTSGNNTFSGQVLFNSGDADFFKFTVPAGMRLSQVTTNGATGINVPSAPQGPSTYTASCNPAPGTFFGDVNWSITLRVDAPADYDITIAGGVMTVTNSANNADTLSLSEPSAGMIGFVRTGRTFSVNGGPNTTNVSNVSLSGITSIIINGASANEQINVGAFSGSSFPSLTINGGPGNDTVNFNGNITFAAGNNLTVNLQSGGSPGSDAINVTAAQLLASGAGTIDLECSRSVSITGGAVVQTVNGNLTVLANQQATATAGNFTGVTVDGAGTKLQVTAQGTLTVNGRGGNDPSGSQLGVNVNGGAQILGGGGQFTTLNVTGTGGASTGIVNRGVTVYGAGSAITSGGDVNVTGIAGSQGSGFGIGVSLLYGGKISSNGLVFGVQVNGTGGGASGGANQGVEIGGSATPASAITASRTVTIRAIPGPGASAGLFMSDAAAIGPAPACTIGADSITLDATSTIVATDASSGVSLYPISATHIDLGGASAAGTLGLSDALLDRVTSPTLQVSGLGFADITISAPITRPSSTDLYLYPNSGGVRAAANGIDLDLAGGTLFLTGPLIMPITGLAADTGFPQLHVLGNVSLANSNGYAPETLNLTGTTYAGLANDTFLIVRNDGAAAIASTFQNLPEGAYLVWPGNPALAAKISYIGGTGNDVTLTLRPVAEALAVTTNANDTSGGSLRAAIAFAAAHSGADTVTFDPSLNGQTITLVAPASGAYAITVSDPSSVVIDASNLTNGLTIQGAGPSGNFGLFYNDVGSDLTLRGLTLKNGGGSTGGAVYSNGTLTLTGCTLTGNSAGIGGAIASLNSGTATLVQCTLFGNSASGLGGAIVSNTPLTVTQCTLSGNSCPPDSDTGGIYCVGATTLTNSIVAGNSGRFGADIHNLSTLTLMGANIVQSRAGGGTAGSGTIINADPLLAPLDNYGGPTKTMALQPGSPARNAAVGSSITSDQRFFPIVGGTPDIGAYEAGTTGTNYNAYIWETLPAGTAVSPQHDTNFDYDGDGVTNFNEYLAQTNASLASSYLHITQFTYGSSTANVTFPSVLGRHYTVEAALSLAAPVSWSPVSGTLTGTGNPITFSTGAGFSKVFFRARVGP